MADFGADSGAAFGAFGSELRFERERRGVSLEALCAQTKVNSRYFEALEHGEYNLLPGGVFRRGIVRAYLTCVGLDEHEWMPRFQASYAERARLLGPDTRPIDQPSDEAWAAFAANVKKNRAAPRPRGGARWFGVLALLLLLLAATWALWRFVLQARIRPF